MSELHWVLPDFQWYCRDQHVDLLRYLLSDFGLLACSLVAISPKKEEKGRARVWLLDQQPQQCLSLIHCPQSLVQQQPNLSKIHHPFTRSYSSS